MLISKIIKKITSIVDKTVLVNKELHDQILNDIINVIFKNKIMIYVRNILLILFYTKKRVIISNPSFKTFKYNIFSKKVIIDMKKNRSRCFINNFFLEKAVVINGAAITRNMFENCISLKKVYVSKTITRIDEYAFRNCINLTKIYIPKTVEIIRHQAFENCINLKKVIFY